MQPPKFPWMAMMAGLLVVMLAAYLILRSGQATIAGNELSVPRAVFTVANAVSLTGFQLSVNVNEFKPVGQATIFTLILTSTLVTLIVGGQALTRILKLPYSDSQIAQATIVVYAFALVVGATFLLNPLSLWESLFRSTGAFSNCGMFIGPPPTATDWKTHVALLPLAFLGGLGIPVILDIWMSLLLQRRVHSHTVMVITLSAAVYLLAFLSILICEYFGENTFRDAVVLGSVETLNSRSLGMPLDAFNHLARPSQWIVVLLMLIGANPAGTGGGIKTTTLYVFFRDSVQVLRGQMVSRVFGLACMWIAIYLIATFATTVLLIAAQPQTAGDRLFFIAVSAIGTVGTSHEPLTLSADALYVLTGAMLFGRFAPMAILCWAARYFASDSEYASR